MMYSRAIIANQRGAERICDVMGMEQKIFNDIMERIRNIDARCPSYQEVQEAQERFNQYLEGQPQEKVSHPSGDFSVEKERDQNYAECLRQLAFYAFWAEKLKNSIDRKKQIKERLFVNGEEMLKTLNERIQDDYNFAVNDVWWLARFRQEHWETWTEKVKGGSKTITTLDWIIEAFLKVRK